MNLYYIESYFLCMHNCLKSKSINACKMCKCNAMFIKMKNSFLSVASLSLFISLHSHCCLQLCTSQSVFIVTFRDDRNFHDLSCFDVFYLLWLSAVVTCITKQKPQQMALLVFLLLNSLLLTLIQTWVEYQVAGPLGVLCRALRCFVQLRPSPRLALIICILADVIQC